MLEKETAFGKFQRYNLTQAGMKQRSAQGPKDHTPRGSKEMLTR
jgi:hypothetical protein